jgi:hypothetical protein
VSDRCIHKTSSASSFLPSFLPCFECGAFVGLEYSRYARFFFGAKDASKWEAALTALERNWEGAPGRNNTGIPHTLALLRTLVPTGALHDGGGGSRTGNWRAIMYLKRAVFDAYVQARYIYEVEEREAHAWELLATAPSVGSRAAILNATAVLRRNSTNASTVLLRAEILRLRELLNATIGSEVRKTPLFAPFIYM